MLSLERVTAAFEMVATYDNGGPRALIQVADWTRKGGTGVNKIPKSSRLEGEPVATVLAQGISAGGSRQ